MTKFNLFLAVLALAVAAIMSAQSPASAGWPGGEVTHQSDDSGYNPPIYVQCNDGRVLSLGLGGYSKGTYHHCQDADAIYVGSGQEVRCSAYGIYWITFDATGWHGVDNDHRLYCYMQLD